MRETTITRSKTGSKTQSIIIIDLSALSAFRLRSSADRLSEGEASFYTGTEGTAAVGLPRRCLRPTWEIQKHVSWMR